MRMTGEIRQTNGWRVAGWSLAAALLTVPFIAMQFTTEVRWTPFDFAAAAAMLLALGGGIELLVRRSQATAYRIGAVLASFTGVTLIWVNLAVGMIGREGDPANAMYAGVLAIAIGGAVLSRGAPRGMAASMGMAGMAQAAAGVAAVAFALDSYTVGWPRDVIGVTVIWTALWMIAAALFLHAARSRR